MFNTNFGTAPSFGAYTSATSTSSNVFGHQQQPQQSTSLFGSGGFNQPKTSFGPTFGSNTSGSTMFQQNRLPGNSASIFSGNSAAVSPFTTSNAQVAGTSVAFSPITGNDTMMRNGSASPISTRHQCITCMKEYETKSLEELRLEDYQLNRKGPTGTAGGSTLFQNNQQPATTNLFGAMANTSASATTFPQPQATFGAATGGLFSTMNQQAKPTFFGAPATSVPSFGATTSTGFPFTGAVSQAGGMFGQTTNTTAGLGTTSTFGGFGQPAQALNPAVSAAPAFGGFGATQNTSLNKPLFPAGGTSGFSQPATNTFGAPAAGGIFGATTQQSKPFGFGTSFGATSTAQPAFGSTASPSFTFSNPTTTPSLNFGISSAPSFGTANTTTLGGFGANSSFFGSGAGATNTLGSNFSFNTPPLNTGYSLFNQANPQATLTTTTAPSIPFATTPFKDSPLFYNLITDRNVEEMKKPTSVIAQRSIKEASKRKSMSIFNTTLGLKNLTYPVRKTTAFERGTIFDGFEEDEYGNSEDLLSPRSSVKKLNMKVVGVGIGSLNSTSKPGHASNSLRSGFDETPEDESVMNGHWGTRRSELYTRRSELYNETMGSKGDYMEMNEGSSAGPRPGTICRIVMNRNGYYIRPDLSELDNLTDDEGNCVVRGLVIGRTNYGEIRFLEPVNIKGINIDEIVDFRHKAVVVYEDESKKPPAGEGLNVPAEIYLHRVWPIDRATKDCIRTPSQVRALNYAEKLKKACARLQCQFLDYEEQEGIWSFKVEHFSKYSCDVEDSDDDEPPSTIPAMVPPKKGLGGQLAKVPGQLGLPMPAEGQLEAQKEVGSGDPFSNEPFHPLTLVPLSGLPGKNFFNEEIENVEMNPLSDTESERDEGASPLDTSTNLLSYAAKSKGRPKRLSLLQSVLFMEMEDELEKEEEYDAFMDGPPKLNRKSMDIPASSYLPRVKQPPGRKGRLSDPFGFPRCDPKRVRDNVEYKTPVKESIALQNRIREPIPLKNHLRELADSPKRKGPINLLRPTQSDADISNPQFTLSQIMERDLDKNVHISSFHLAYNLKNLNWNRREARIWKPRRDDQTLFARVKKHRECLDSRSRGGGRVSFGPLGSYTTIFQVNIRGHRSHVVRINGRYDGRPVEEKLRDEEKELWDKFQVSVLEKQMEFFAQKFSAVAIEPCYFKINDPEFPLDQMTFLRTFKGPEKASPVLKEPENPNFLVLMESEKLDVPLLMGSENLNASLSVLKESENTNVLALKEAENLNASVLKELENLNVSVFKELENLNVEVLKESENLKVPVSKEIENLKVEYEMWRLISILWPPQSTLIPETDASFGSRKRRLLSAWFVENAKLLFGKNYDETDSSVFGLVAKGHQSEAIKTALEDRNFFLASCLGMMRLNGRGRLYLDRQIQMWEKFEVWKHIDYKTMILYKLCAGLPVWDGKLLREMTSYDWLYYFALYLWYLSPQAASVEKTVLAFQASLQGGEPDLEFPANAISGIPNLCVNLLKMASHYGYPMHRIVAPRCSALDALNYKIPWMVMKHLCGSCGLTIDLHLEEDVTLGFATMLEDLGMIHWAKFVLSCLPISRTRNLIMNKLDERMEFEERRRDQNRVGFTFHLSPINI